MCIYPLLISFLICTIYCMFLKERKRRKNVHVEEFEFTELSSKIIDNSKSERKSDIEENNSSEIQLP